MGNMPPVRHWQRFEYFAARVIAEIAFASVGTALLACALVANQRFLDRHFVPSFFLPRHWYVVLETFGRLAMAILGALLVLVARPRAARFAARTPARALHVVIAVVLALGASELALRHVHLRPAEWLSPDDEPRRQFDPRLGWTLAPARTGHKSVGGRVIDYAIDPAGYRVSRVDEPVDPERPTILFTGESVMFGEGLTWQESVPAQVGAMMGMQTANLAVHGYGNDQAYLRLQMELPHFRRPVAVVSLFMTAVFGRNLDEDRPHFGPGLVWLPAKQHSRLASLAKLLVPYRADATVERGVTVTREVLRATGELARAHGATPLLVVLQFGHEELPEQTLRLRILDDTGLPYVLIEIDSAWRLPWDRHPNARAAHAIAVAIAAELRGRLTVAGSVKLTSQPLILAWRLVPSRLSAAWSQFDQAIGSDSVLGKPCGRLPTRPRFERNPSTDRAADFPEAEFWPGLTSEWPVNRPRSLLPPNTRLWQLQLTTIRRRRLLPAARAADEVILPEISGVNQADGLKRVAGNRRLYRDLLGQFAAKQGDATRQISAAIESEDLKHAERIAHTVKGVAGNIGIGEVESAAERLEKAVREGSDSVPALLQEFAAALSTQVQAIEGALRKSAPARQEEVRKSPFNGEAASSAITRLKTSLQASDGDAEEAFRSLRT